MRKLTTQTQNSNSDHRHSQHYPRLITGNYIPNDPANANDPIALRRQRIAPDYHDISEDSDADR